MERREHDIFMDILANPLMSYNSLIGVGLNSSNTSLLEPDVYKNNDWVKLLMQDLNGLFDLQLFLRNYELAQTMYNLLMGDSHDELIRKLITYHRDNIFVPKELRRSGPDFLEITIANPYLTSSGIISFGKTGPRTKSVDELALSNKVLLNPLTAGDNLENAQWGESPNDNFFGYFTTPLVLALYDTDGEHIDPITGLTVKHSKGDLKLDEDGNFYYEKLDGRDPHNRMVLNKMNVLTVDGSKWNKYDFFDSDDIDLKSIGGSILKNLALVGTMFIPTVGPYIAALSVATQSAGLMATLGKMLTGSDSPTLNNIEGLALSFNRQNASTEYARLNPWSWENMINMAGDVTGLLAEQRFLFKAIPTLFSGTNIYTKAGLAAKLKEFEKARAALNSEKLGTLAKSGADPKTFAKWASEARTDAALLAGKDLESFIQGYLKVGEILSKGYMTGITVADTYGEAKAAGASDLEATLLTLGYAAAEYKLISTGLGEWIMPELRAGRYKAEAIMKSVLNMNLSTSELYNLLKSVVPSKAKKDYAKKLFNIGKNIARAEYSNGVKTLGAVAAGGLGEGIEESTEELLADFAKSAFNTVLWLQGDDTRMDSFGYNYENKLWNPEDITTRYGLSFVGGLFGGAAYGTLSNYKDIRSYTNMTSQLAMLELVYMARNGLLDKFRKLMNRMEISDPNLTILPNANGEYELVPSDRSNSLDAITKRALNNLLDIIESIINANGANLSDDSFLNKISNGKEILGDLRFNAVANSATAGAYLQEFNSLTSDIISLTTLLNSLTSADKNGDGVVTDKEQRTAEKSNLDKELKEKIKLIGDELKKKLNQLKDLLDGKRSLEFIRRTLFETTTLLGGIYSTPTFPLFAEKYYGKKYSELTNEEKEEARKVYKNLKPTEGKDAYRDMADIHFDFVLKTSDILKKYNKIYAEVNPTILGIDRLLAIYRNMPENFNLSEAQKSETLLNSNLEDLIEHTSPNAAQLKELSAKLKSFPKEVPEEQKSEYILLTLDYVRLMSDEVINRVAKLYLDRGFINLLSKEALQLLLNGYRKLVIASEGAWLDQNWDMRDEVNPWSELNLNLLKTINDIGKLLRTPIEKSLDEISIASEGEPIKLSELILNVDSIYNLVRLDVSNFNIDEPLYTNLKNAISTLKLYKAAVLGAKTDSAGLNDIYGYNAILNEISLKIEGLEKLDLAQIDKNVADLFIADIDENLNKLDYLKKLYDLNRNQKLTRNDRVATKKDTLIYNRLKYLVNTDLSGWKGATEFKNLIEGLPLHSKLSNDGNELLEKEDKENFLKENLAIEDGVYNFFLLNADKVNDINQLATLLNPSKLGLYTRAGDLLNEDLSSIDDNSLLWWLASRAAVKASSFYKRYANIINPTGEGALAPVPTQELAVYNNYASIVNGDIYTKFYKAYRQSVKRDWENKSIEERLQVLRNLGYTELLVKDLSADLSASYALSFLTIPKFLNIIFTEGIPGAGKTTGVFQPTLKMLAKYNPEVLLNVAVVHGVSLDKANGLLSSLGLKNSKAFGRQEFMNNISSLWKEYSRDQNGTYKIPSSDYTLTLDGEYVSTLNPNATTNPYSLILIDEVSKFSKFDLDLIDKYAKKYGLTVLTAGDLDLIGVTGAINIKINGKPLTYTIGIERTDFARSPKLGVSMRSNSSIKTTNLDKAWLHMRNPSNDLELDYYEDETGLYGDRVFNWEEGGEGVENDPDFLDNLKLIMSTLKEGEKIGYIYNNPQSKIFELLSSSEYSKYIDFKEGGNALGDEGQYYIVDLEGNGNEDFLKAFYTGLSRSSLGSIIVTTYKKAKSRKVKDLLISELPKDLISKYAQGRKDILLKLVDSAEDITYIPRTKENLLDKVRSTPSEPILTTSGGLLGGIDPTPPLLPLPQVTPEPLPNPAPSQPPVVSVPMVITQLPEEIINLSLDEVQQLFGENASNIIVQYEGQEIPINLKLIPFTYTQDGKTYSGYSTVVNADVNTPIVVAEVGNLSIPFAYLAADSLRPEGWYPIFGYNNGVNLPNDASVINYYSIPLLKEIAVLLNKVLGEASGPLSADVLTTPLYDFINSNFSDVIKGNVNYDDVILLKLLELRDKLNIEVPNILVSDPVVDLLKALPAPIYEENDSAPITNTDIIPEEEYKLLIDISNITENIPQSTILETDKGIEINMLMHSFNSFETGVIIHSDRTFSLNDPSHAEVRIDSVNGLYKLPKFGKSNKIDPYLNAIGNLRNIIFNTKDKSDICKLVEAVLGLKNIYCTFALKSSPYFGENTRNNTDREFLNDTPSKCDKGKSERTMFNGSTDEHSQEWHPKSIVAIFGTEKDGDVLELPLLSLSSPFTLMQTESQGIKVFDEIFLEYQKLLAAGDSLHNISLALVLKFDGDTRYQNLINLFKLFNFTDEGIFFINDPKWTIANNLLLFGPAIVQDRGMYLQAPGLSYDVNSIPEAEWVNISDFAKRPDISISKRILLSKSGMTNDTEDKYIINPGHPFILISFDKKLNNDKKMLEYFIRQEADPSIDRKVIRLYVLPPKATIEEYIGNLENILNRKEHKDIGNLFTPYKLFRILLTDVDFSQMFSLRYPKLYAKVQSTIDKLNQIEDPQELKNALYTAEDWSDVGLGASFKLLNLLRSSLVRSVSTKNNINSYIGEDPISLIEPELLKMASDVLNRAGVDGVYYHAFLPNDAKPVGLFYIPVQGDNYTIGGQPCKIHGKIDSYIFLGNLDNFIQLSLDKLRPTKSGNHLYSPDTTRYRNQGSNIWSTRKNSPRQNKINLETLNIINYIKLKINIDITDLINLRPISEVLNSVISSVNGNSNLLLIAFRIGDQIYISNSDLTLNGSSFIYDSIGNSISDISQLGDNNGNYTFRLSKVNLNGTTNFTAIFNPTNKVLTLNEDLLTSLLLTPVLDMQEEMFSAQFLPLIQTVLNTEDFEGDPMFEDLSSINTIADFTTYIASDDFIPDTSYISGLENLKQLLTPDLQAIIDYLINSINYYDPDKDINNACPIDINISF